MAYMKDADQLLSNVVGLENYSKEELIDIVRRWCEHSVDEAEWEVVIHNVYLTGSRVTGDAKEDDDLDALVYYTVHGWHKDLYSLWNSCTGTDEDLVIDGVEVEVHPRPISEKYAAS